MKTPKIYKKILILFVIAVLFMTFLPETGETQNLEWFVNSNPSTGDDKARSITAEDDYIYIAGYDSSPGNLQWRIEKRRKSDGGVEWTQTINPSSGDDTPRSITADDNYIYIAGNDNVPGNGQWRIEKRRKSDGGMEPGWPVTNNPSSDQDFATAITADDSYIYIAGDDNVPAGSGGTRWRIEKRRKSDGGVEWTAIYPPSGFIDFPLSITKDNNYIYVVGVSDGMRWHVEKRRKLDGGVEWIDVVPMSSFGAITPVDGANSVIEDGNYIYIAGGSNDWVTNGAWRIEKRRKSDGGVEWERTIDPYLPDFEEAWSIVGDNNYLYIAGYDKFLGATNQQWRIEKRQKSPYIDIGLRVFNGTEIVAIAAEIGPATSPLRIAKNGVVYGIALIDQGSPEYGDPLYDSGVRIQTSSGIKALRRL